MEPSHDGGEWRAYRSPTCFACQERGHYANQCPNRSRRYSSARPSTSFDSRRSHSPRRHDVDRRDPSPQLDPVIRNTIAKLGKSVAVMEEHYTAEREKKEVKKKKKLEREEAERRAEEERARLEEQRTKAKNKALKKKQEKQKADETRAEMQKDMQIQLAIQKRKRGPEPVFVEASPPMELSAKRTPKRGTIKPVKLTGRLTRSKTKKAGGGLTPTSAKKKIATPLSKRRTPTRKQTPAMTPTSKSSMERLRFLDNILRELKDLDATELQRICRDEGIHYDKKVDAIFDIADHRTEVAFSSAPAVTEEVIHIADSEDTAVDQKERPADDV
ncbi:hypothetical protein CBR_g11234 [Chara braunii]|uniref:CCHC-type domain-containing protein n=1 Tax=Chara braunii TaxID=69332 RepID=A0A388KQH8_CHABU|nr:hypothetical protein CBR_g11234 [Chara braunii]|eukprot:GBG72305.1 hypothetical protein CBR_g11234 [Chara braunii]